ncbi:MAG TPA: hydroxymethylbilane synthase [Ktedonobacteraceae bacterium]|nr:hydroxymethylbilane synthase [Ktedonobacteraceae bacterium]
MLQTQSIVERLHRQLPTLDISIEQIHTRGDHNTTQPLTEIGGDGVFVMEIERALLDGRIDLAIHSLKDLPTTQPDGLQVWAVADREDARDAIIWHDEQYAAIDENPGILRIGTCSLRRSAQLRALLPQVDILPLRGNVDTRLRKLDAGDYDGIVLAAAGLHRLGMHQQLEHRMTYLSLEEMLPAPGQGALALEIRDEAALRALLAPLLDSEVQATTSAERMFMRRLGAGCYLPIAAYGEILGGRLTLQGLVISLDGKEQVRVRASTLWTSQTGVEYAELLGVQLAEQALAEGAAAIIQTVEEGQVREHA